MLLKLRIYIRYILCTTTRVWFKNINNSTKLYHSWYLFHVMYEKGNPKKAGALVGTNLYGIPALYEVACHIESRSPHNHGPYVMPRHSRCRVSIHQVCQETRRIRKLIRWLINKQNFQHFWTVPYLGKAGPSWWSPSLWSWCSPFQPNTLPCHSVHSGCKRR